MKLYQEWLEIELETRGRSFRPREDIECILKGRPRNVLGLISED